MLIFFVTLVIVSVYVANAIEFKSPPPTFDAATFTSWDKRTVEGSRKGKIFVSFTDSDQNDDFVEIQRLDLLGDIGMRGFAQGALLAHEIIEFVGPQLTKYFADEILNIDISNYPEPLQKILQVLKIKGAKVAPTVFREAMAWVWDQEAKYVPGYLIEEMDSIAKGICSTLGNGCSPDEWSQKLKEVNMLPELIRMACTAFGAWKDSTASNTLIQLRALDFGSGPFANFTILAVHRNDPNNPDNAFASLTFPGFVGVITGISQRGIGVSEKVWMTYDRISLQPGHYNGEADVFVLRDILEFSKSKADAEAFLRDANRTFAIWIGIGDYDSMQFDLVGYKEDSSIVYSDVTAPSMTGQPYIPNIAYVDKHPQPSGEGPEGTLPSALQALYGNISLETTKIITQYHQTGDLHIASYDFGSKEMYISVGRINADGFYYPESSSNHNAWMAFNRPYLRFSLTDLWSGK